MVAFTLPINGVSIVLFLALIGVNILARTLSLESSEEPVEGFGLRSGLVFTLGFRAMVWLFVRLTSVATLKRKNQQ